MAKIRKSDRDEAIARLRELVKPGMTVYTTIRRVSRSGMQRVIDAHLIRDNEPWWIGRLVAFACGYRYDDKNQGVVVSGAGMDMGFHLVYCLGQTLFPDGFIPAECGLHGRNRTPDTERDPCGGYALKQRWL